MPPFLLTSKIWAISKSTLLRCLNQHRAPRKGDSQPNISTDGIEIGTGELTVKVTRENETKEVTLTTWDFAGTGDITERQMFLILCFILTLP